MLKFFPMKTSHLSVFKMHLAWVDWKTNQIAISCISQKHAPVGNYSPVFPQTRDKIPMINHVITLRLLNGKNQTILSYMSNHAFSKWFPFQVIRLIIFLSLTIAAFKAFIHFE